MKVIIEIGSSKFLANDAAAAAKVADLLGKMKPVTTEYLKTTAPIYADLLEKSYDHRIRIVEPTRILADREEFRKFEEEELAKEAAK